MIKNKVRVKMLFAALCLCFVGTTASAQRNALKTNALYWATGTANLAYEYRLSPRWTLGTSVAWNSWCYYGKKERNRKPDPEPTRYNPAEPIELNSGTYRLIYRLKK